MKILVIDKDPDLAELVNLTLTMRWPDLDIVVAPDGVTGILMADTEIPALVILDTCLPDLMLLGLISSSVGIAVSTTTAAG